jgi:hypothetical protein
MLGVLVEWGDCSRGAEPRVDGDVVLVFVAQATVVGDADVFFQLGDLHTQTPRIWTFFKRYILVISIRFSSCTQAKTFLRHAAQEVDRVGWKPERG